MLCETTAKKIIQIVSDIGHAALPGSFKNAALQIW